MRLTDLVASPVQTPVVSCWNVAFLTTVRSLTTSAIFPVAIAPDIVSTPLGMYQVLFPDVGAVRKMVTGPSVSTMAVPGGEAAIFQNEWLTGAVQRQMNRADELSPPQ